MKREVGSGILFSLLRNKGPFAIIGIVFTLVSIFVLIPLLIIVGEAIKTPFEKYDFSSIKKNGKEKTAEVTNLKRVSNVNVNGEHPSIISYVYKEKGQQVTDKFETFDYDKIANLKPGSEVTVLVYQHQSMIKGLTPFSFPIQFFYILPGIFLAIGIPFLLIGLVPAIRTFNLYKTGIVKDAYIVSISMNSTLLSQLSPTNKSILVSYYYLDKYKNTIFGESTTTDILILNEKKEGDIVKILVSETDETKSCLVPKLEALKNNWAL